MSTGHEHPRPSETWACVARGALVSLRYPVEADAQEMVRIRSESRAFLEPWEATPDVVTDPFADDWFARFLKSSRCEASHRLLICHLHDGRILGQVGLGGIMRGAFQSCFIGYWIAAKEARRGYGTEGVALAVSYCFGALALHRVEANIIPVNEPSKRLVRKLGFRFEGLARRYLRIAGHWQDHEHWAITIEEWNAHRPAGSTKIPTPNQIDRTDTLS